MVIDKHVCWLVTLGYLLSVVLLLLLVAHCLNYIIFI
jgi:hypothetical protein